MDCLVCVLVRGSRPWCLSITQDVAIVCCVGGQPPNDLAATTCTTMDCGCSCPCHSCWLWPGGWQNWSMHRPPCYMWPMRGMRCPRFWTASRHLDLCTVWCYDRYSRRPDSALLHGRGLGFLMSRGDTPGRRRLSVGSHWSMVVCVCFAAIIHAGVVRLRHEGQREPQESAAQGVPGLLGSCELSSPSCLPVCQHGARHFHECLRCR